MSCGMPSARAKSFPRPPGRTPSGAESPQRAGERAGQPVAAQRHDHLAARPPPRGPAPLRGDVARLRDAVARGPAASSSARTSGSRRRGLPPAALGFTTSAMRRPLVAQKPSEARCAAHSPRAAPVSSPASTGWNSISSAPVARAGGSSRGWSGSAGSHTSSSSCSNAVHGSSSVSCSLADQHDVLALRALQVEVVVGLRVGVEVGVAHQPEELVDPEAVCVQPPPVAEDEVERREPAALADFLDAPAACPRCRRGRVAPSGG